MAKANADRGYRIMMTVLLILLAGAVALFCYGSAHNRIHTPAPRLLSIPAVQQNG